MPATRSMASYQVLARKYRPQRFADVVGQEHVTQTLLNALAQDRIAHGYIFSGHRGIGKTTIARILAMALECRTPKGSAERPTPEPCGVCEACVEIRAGSAIDVIEIDAATNRGIDEIRELREGARYSPARDRFKIYILDEAHQITDAAFNALLKTLEEPPAHVIFMMATTQPEDIPQTIRSRCQHFSFHAVRFDDIVTQLRGISESESVSADDAALSLLAEAGDGSMRDALSIMDQAIASAPVVEGRHVLEATQVRSLMGAVSNQVFEKMMEAVEQHDAAAMLDQAAQLLDAGNGPQPIARQMVRFLRNCLMARIAGAKSELLQISEEERARAERVASRFSEEDLTRFLNSMLRTFDDLGYRQEQRFHLELGLLKLVHMQRLLPFEELFRQLSGGAGTAGSLAGSGAKTTGAPTTTKPTAAPRSEETSRPITAESPTTMPEPVRLEEVFARSSARETVPPVTAVGSSPVGLTEKTVSIPEIGSASTAETHHVEKETAPATTVPLPESPKPSESLPQTAPSSPPATPDCDAEMLRIAICRALAQGGQETVSTKLEAGEWEWDGSELRVRVGVTRTLLDMIYTAQAQQIVRENFRKLTQSARPVKIEPGQVSTKPAQPVPREIDSSEGRPQDHPLIRHAQELFRAEIRSVVSLRNSR